LLTLFGTFLTRSGILASVHAFTEGLIGPFFLGFITLVLIVSLALVAWRSDLLKSKPALDSVASRETVFLLNNLLFVAFTFTVLLGTVYPLIAEAVRGVKVSVGAPYFNRMSVPIALGLVLLVGVGPALPWRRGSPELLLKKFIWPGAIALIAGVVFWLAGATHFTTWLTLVLSVFSVGLIWGEFWRPAQARRTAHGENLGAAFLNLMGKNRRRYGGYVVHLGIVVMAVGIALSSTYRRERETTLAVGEAIAFSGYDIRLDSLYAGREPQRDFVEAAFSIANGGERLAVMRPRLNYYPMSDSPIGTPHVRTRPTEDLYLSLSAYARDGSTATVNIIVNPMVVWIWIGGGIIALGALFAISTVGFSAERSEQREAARGSLVEPVKAGVGGAD
jgi:cytochrome c-type biogenesis protein CcmF